MIRPGARVTWRRGRITGYVEEEIDEATQTVRVRDLLGTVWTVCVEDLRAA